MKQQAFAFFTMFSLILMLSVYYISYPQEVSSSKESVSVIESIQDKNEDNKQKEKEINDAIIASDSSSEEKEKAIIENEQIKENQKIEKQISSYLKENGYDCNIEIKNNTMLVLINQKEDELVARNVLKLVYTLVQQDYLIEVTFS